MTIPCQDCHDEFEDIPSWITHQSIMHEQSRRDGSREYQKNLNS